MMRLLVVGLGGFLGSMARYGIASTFQSLLKNPLFPYATLAINTLGCLILGIFAGLVEKRALFSQDTQEFIFFGFLGGFTTFSAFGNETFHLIRTKQPALAALNIFGQVFLGLLAVWIGRLLIQIFLK